MAAFNQFKGSLLTKSSKLADLVGDVERALDETGKGPDSTEGKRVAKSLGVKSGECILHARGYAFKHLDQACVQSSCGASHAVASELGSENPELILLCCSKDHCIRRGRHHYLGRGVRSMREFGCGDGQFKKATSGTPEDKECFDRIGWLDSCD